MRQQGGIHPSQPETVPDEWMTGFLRAVNQIPLDHVLSGMVLAKLILQSGRDIPSFENVTISEEQIERALIQAKKAHSAFGIERDPLLNPGNMGVVFKAGIYRATSLIQELGYELVKYREANDLYKLLQEDKSLSDKIIKALNAGILALETDEAKKLARDRREVIASASTESDELGEYNMNARHRRILLKTGTLTGKLTSLSRKAIFRSLEQAS